MKRICRLLRMIGAIVFAFSAVFPVTSADSSAPIIRTELVLRVGLADISWYALNKNVVHLRGSNSGDKADSRSWFEPYLARQVMIAEALAQGYAQRSEVILTVDSMERNMLAQLDRAVAPPTDAELYSVYEKIVVLPGRAKPSFEELRVSLERTLIRQSQQAAMEAGRKNALQAAGLVVADEIAGKLVQRIRVVAAKTATVASDTIGSLASDVVATYRLGESNICLTVDAWRKRFNQQFVRVLPTDTAQLKANIEELVVMDYACRSARARGLDGERQFLEDRRNFLYYQALDLFEKEQLLPRIEISATETEAYYSEHSPEFRRPVRARGKLLHFADEASAAEWLRTRSELNVIKTEEIVISRQSPLPGPLGATELILRMQTGRPFGPIRTASDVIIVLKEDTEVEQQPYSEVADAIYENLAHAKLEALEERLAREWSSKFSIEDNLHPEEFGIVGPIQRPWVANRVE